MTFDFQILSPKTKTKNLYSQINHTLQWYREVTYKNTTQHIHDKEITDTQRHIQSNLS